MTGWNQVRGDYLRNIALMGNGFPVPVLTLRTAQNVNVIAAQRMVSKGESIVCVISMQDVMTWLWG
jgi:hypothetical protein